MPKPSLLFVDDLLESLVALTRSLAREFMLVTAASLSEAQAKFGPGIDAVVTDIRLVDADETNRDGVALLEWVKAQRPEVPVVLMTAYAETDVAIEALNLGADYFLKKPFQAVELKALLRQLLEGAQLRQENVALRRRLRAYESEEFIGTSPALAELRRDIAALAADGQATGLLRGETGSGKELAAQAIHRAGPRRDGPFVAVALNALATGTFENDLFGHEPGSFTDARELKIGLLEAADGGVLFCDEVDKYSLEVQAKLLRVIETGEFYRLGGTQPIRVNVQFLFATNADLEAAVRAGTFRQDFYFRIRGGLTLHVPPLRERPEDLSLLAQHFLTGLGEAGRTACVGFDDAVWPMLRAYPWPGNVRELRAAVESAALRARVDGVERIGVDHLPLEVRAGQSPLADVDAHSQSLAQGKREVSSLLPEGIDLGRELARAELDWLEAALKAVGGRRTEAHTLLGLNDRDAFRRRVQACLRKYPDLAAEFPLLSRGTEGTFANDQ